MRELHLNRCSALITLSKKDVADSLQTGSRNEERLGEAFIMWRMKWLGQFSFVRYYLGFHE